MSELEPLSAHELAHTMWTQSNARTFYFYGTKGTGKTSLAVKYGYEVSDHVIKVTLNDGDMAAKYEGFYRPKAGEFEFTRGLMAEAWTFNGGEGCPIVIDEVDHASSEVLSLLYAILDDPKVAQLSLPDNSIIKPGPKFRAFLTSNQPPSAVPEPLADRAEVKIRFIGPSPEMLATLDPDVAKVAAALMRTDIEGGASLSFRDLKHFTDFRKSVPDYVAAQAAFGSKYSDILTAIRAAK